MGVRPEDLTPERLLALSQGGDEGARNELIERFMPFVLKVAARVAGRYMEVGRDEEISVCLLAFNEAIDAFQEGRGSFLGFAETVMRRRLIDYYRKHHGRGEVPFSQFVQEDDEGQVFDPVDVRKSIDAWQRQRESEARRGEIARYAALLATFGLHFDDLPRLTPKHRDARENAIGAARQLVSDRDLFEEFMAQHQLPLKVLAERSHLSRKTLERNRRYIVAVALAMRPDFEYLSSYLDRREEGGR